MRAACALGLLAATLGGPARGWGGLPPGTVLAEDPILPIELSSPRPSAPGNSSEGEGSDGKRDPDSAAPRPFLIQPRLLLDARPTRDAPGKPVKIEPRFIRSATGDELRAEVEDRALGLVAHLRFRRLDPAGAGARIELTVDTEYRKPVWLALLALTADLPGAAEVLDRERKPRKVDHAAYLDRFAGKSVRGDTVNLLVDDGVDGVAVKRDGARTNVEVELYSVEERPFRHDSRCLEDWRKDNPKLAVQTRLRARGDRDHARLVFYGGDGPVLEKSRFPDGRSAALLITDHADQTSPDTFTALARGRSDATSAVGGFLGHKLLITKSLFLRGEIDGEGRRQLEDARVAEVAEQMLAAGDEIIPHSITPNPDERAVTAAGLDRFDHYRSVTWIDHQPETNCEAFNNQGWRGAGEPDAERWRIADLLSQHGYRYLWSAFDQSELDLLGDGRLDKRAPSLWPLGRLAPGDSDDRWMFKTVWMLLDRDAFYRALGPDRLDRLERLGGIAILHTYLEALHAASDPTFGTKNVLRHTDGGVVETEPRFEKLLADLQARVERGTLWMPTLAGLGDRLRALDRMRTSYADDGTATVEAPLDLPGLTLSVAGEVNALVDGKPPRGQRRDRGVTTFWFDLHAGHAARVELRDGAGRVGLLARRGGGKVAP